MKVLMVGDVVGTSGLKFLRRELPKLKQTYKVDVCVVNGENAADGNGITAVAAEHIFTSGADVITTGNHAFRRREAYSYFDDCAFVLRPLNYRSAPGRGFCVIDKGSYSVGVINAQGTMYLDPLDNPFFAVDNALQDSVLSKCSVILVDFHAEATSEKKALGFYLDGRVSAVVGTHTHVQTSDECVLSSGTGYITDLGMTGPLDSVLGVTPSIVINKFKYNMPTRFDWKQGKCELGACLFDIDPSTGKCLFVSRILVKEE